MAVFSISLTLLRGNVRAKERQAARGIGRLGGEARALDALGNGEEALAAGVVGISRSTGRSGLNLMSAKKLLERINQRYQGLVGPMEAADVLGGDAGRQALGRTLTVIAHRQMHAGAGKQD